MLSQKFFFYSMSTVKLLNGGVVFFRVEQSQTPHMYVLMAYTVQFG